MMTLNDKVALVTGATSGIGAAIAETLAGAGAGVLLTGRGEARGEKVLRKVIETGGRAEFLAGDIGKADFCERLVGECITRFGRFDILVNNAGTIHRANAHETSDEAWRQVMAVNLDAPFRLSRAAVRQFRTAGGGVIVNIASEWGLKGGRNALAYCVSKGGLVQMTRAMALDHGREGIRVNAVCPGSTDTPMLSSAFEARGLDHDGGMAVEVDTIPLGRVATPGDIAQAVLYLASDASASVTGAMLCVDGGTTV